MNLDDDELEIALIGLRQAGLANGPVDRHTVVGAYIYRKMDALIARIEQHQKDAAAEKVDG